MKAVRRLMYVAASGFVILTGCATAGGAAGNGRSSGNADLITRAEITDRSYTTAFAAVTALRPIWLRLKPESFTGAPTEVVVFLDNVEYGGPQSLRSVPAESIESLEYINPMTATQRWGTGYTGGAIVVHTRTP